MNPGDPKPKKPKNDKNEKDQKPKEDKAAAAPQDDASKEAAQKKAEPILSKGEEQILDSMSQIIKLGLPESQHERINQGLAFRF